MALLDAVVGSLAFVLASWVWIQLMLRALALSPPLHSWEGAWRSTRESAESALACIPWPIRRAAAIVWKNIFDHVSLVFQDPAHEEQWRRWNANLGSVRDARTPPKGSSKSRNQIGSGLGQTDIVDVSSVPVQETVVGVFVGEGLGREPSIKEDPQPAESPDLQQTPPVKFPSQLCEGAAKTIILANASAGDNAIVGNLPGSDNGAESSTEKSPLDQVLGGEASKTGRLQADDKSREATPLVQKQVPTARPGITTPPSLENIAVPGHPLPRGVFRVPPNVHVNSCGGRDAKDESKRSRLKAGEQKPEDDREEETIDNLKSPARMSGSGGIAEAIIKNRPASEPNQSRPSSARQGNMERKVKTRKRPPNNDFLTEAPACSLVFPPSPSAGSHSSQSDGSSRAFRAKQRVEHGDSPRGYRTVPTSPSVVSRSHRHDVGLIPANNSLETTNSNREDPSWNRNLQLPDAFWCDDDDVNLPIHECDAENLDLSPHGCRERLQARARIRIDGFQSLPTSVWRPTLRSSADM